MALLKKHPKLCICLQIPAWPMQNTSDRRAKQSNNTWGSKSELFSHQKPLDIFPALPELLRTLSKPSNSAAVTGFIWPPSKPDLWGMLPACTRSLIRLPTGPCKPLSPLCGAGFLEHRAEAFVLPLTAGKWWNSILRWANEIMELFWSFPRETSAELHFQKAQQIKVLWCRTAICIYRCDRVTRKHRSWAHFLSSLTGSAEQICSQLIYQGKDSSKIQPFLLYTCISAKKFLKMM